MKAARILAVMFCLGFFALVAQVVFMREMLVAFYGNELVIGAILACWFVGIGAGAYAARWILIRLRSLRATRRLLAACLMAAALLWPIEVYGVRTVRMLLPVLPGEYVPFGMILLSALLCFLPVCLTVGFAFPAVCELLVYSRAHPRAQGDAVSAVYTVEAFGSMVAGGLLTYVLLPRLTPLQLVLVGCGAAFSAGRCLLEAGWGRRLTAVCIAACILLALGYPAWLEQVEWQAARARWRAFGVLPAGDSADGRPPVRLVASRDTRYQNLAVTVSQGQYVLYGNGQALFTFPDPILDEHRVHTVMAQKPGARRVLLLGGNPVGDLTELLKYPEIEQIVYVNLDPGVNAILAAVIPELLEASLAQTRVQYVAIDAPRFVRQCRDTFDVAIVHAPEPDTAAANRFYTLAFYESIRRLLTADGFMATAVTSGERLESEAAALGASVWRTLREVFPVVLVTAGSENRLLAGFEGSGLTHDRQTLWRRSREAGIQTRFFHPEYFLAADEIDPEKTALVEQRFAEAGAPLNRNLRPATYFYNLMLWSRFSESGLSRLLAGMRRIRAPAMAVGMLATGALLLLGGALARRASARSAGAWSRSMTGLLLASTGFCAMAFEILLVLLFQALYGYVYTRMGIIVAAFMLGLIAGAPSGRIMARGSHRRTAWRMAGLEVGLLACAAVIPWLGRQAAAGVSGWNMELAIYGMVVIVGWFVGAEFPMGNRLFRDAGASIGAAAGVTDACDHLGAAFGSLVVGVVLVPVLGVGASCLVLGALKGFGLLVLASAVISLPPRTTAQAWRPNRGG